MRLLLDEAYYALLDLLTRRDWTISELCRARKRSRQTMHEELSRLVRLGLVRYWATRENPLNPTHHYVAVAKEFRFSPEIIKVARKHMTLDGRARDEILRLVVINDYRDRILRLLSETYGKPGKARWTVSELQQEIQIPEILLLDQLTILEKAGLVSRERSETGGTEYVGSPFANIAFRSRLKWKLEVVAKGEEGFFIRRRRMRGQWDPTFSAVEHFLEVRLQPRDKDDLLRASDRSDPPFVRYWESLDPKMSTLPIEVPRADVRTAALYACLAKMTEAEFADWVGGFVDARNVLLRATKQTEKALEQPPDRAV